MARVEEIVKDGVLSNHIKEVETLVELYKQLDKEAVDYAKTIEKATTGNAGKSAKEIQQLNTALVEVNKVQENKIKIDKELQRNQEKLNKLRSDEGVEIEKLKVQISEQRKETKALAKEELGLVSAYDQLKKKTNEAELNFKKLAAQHGVNSKEARKAKKEFDALDKELREINNAARDGRRDVGRYGLALGNAGSQLKSLASGLGIVGGIALLTKGLRESFRIVSDFGQAQADLASVLAVNTDEMAALTKQSKELGATTKFTASEVSNLQLEYAKLGFTQKEIQDVTEATLQLAAASGTDLANAASITGSTLRAFGLDASETQRVVDVMAKSFSTSSLDIDKFKAAMGSVAPVAKGAGFTIEETTALLGTLTDAGIDASTAGTGLRNIFLELTKQGITFEDAMSQINGAANKNGKALELFGKRGAALGVILAENGVSIDSLTAKLEESGGAAEEMAEKQLDTLNGSLDLLKSAWEGYILGADGATGASENLKGILKFLAENLNQVIGAVTKVISLWGSYKIAVKAAENINKLFGKSLPIKGIGALGLAITGVVMIVQEFIASLNEGFDASERLAEVQDKITESVAQETDKLKLLGKQLLAANTASTERANIISKINAEYGTTLENLEDETEFVNQLADAYRKVVSELQNKITAQVIEQELLELNKGLRELQRTAEELEQSGDIFGGDSSLAATLREDEGKIKATISELEKELIGLQNSVNENTAAGSKSATDSLTNRFKEEEKEENKAKKTADQRKLDELKAFQDLQDQKLKILENTLRQEKADEEFIQQEIAAERIRLARETGQKIIDLNFEDQSVLIDFQNEYLRTVDANATERVDVEVAAIETVSNAEDDLHATRIKNEEDYTDALKESANNAVKIAEELAARKSAILDAEIEREKESIQERQGEVERLNELGTANAAEAIKAEKQAIAKDQLEIEELQRTKRDLLLTVTLLQGANTAFQNGASFNDVGTKIDDFVANLPTFRSGTEGTLGETLGRTGTIDGHVIRADDNEIILNEGYVNQARSVGLNTSNDIITAAMRHQTGGMRQRAMKPSVTSFDDTNIINKLARVERAIMNMPDRQMDGGTLIETIKTASRIDKVHHKAKTNKT